MVLKLFVIITGLKSSKTKSARQNHVQGVYKILSFFQEFSKVCNLSLASTWLLWLYKKLPANRSDCTYTRIALRALEVA